MSKHYAKYLPKTIQESYVAATQDPELMSMKDEMALLRALLGERLVKLQESDVDDDDLKAIGGVIDRISKVQQSISQHEARQREVIPAKMLPLLIRAICQIIRNVVQDERTVSLIRTKIAELPSMPVKMIEVDTSE